MLSECMFCFWYNMETTAPVAGELYSMSLSLSFLSYNHFVKKPATTSTFTVVSNPHPADLPDGYCLDNELIQLEWKNNSNKM